MTSLHISGPLTTNKLNIMQAFSEACNRGFDAEVQQTLLQYPGITQDCARDVVYLRERSRHTPELEARLIREHAEGKDDPHLRLAQPQ